MTWISLVLSFFQSKMILITKPLIIYDIFLQIQNLYEDWNYVILNLYFKNNFWSKSGLVCKDNWQSHQNI
jgi:hypothetical protein